MNRLAFDRFLASLPKTETHLHVEGALPWELLEQKYPDRFLTTPFFREPDFRYENFEQFESILIEHAMCWFDSVESYHEAAKVIFSKHLQQNVKYVETSFHAGMMEFLKLILLIKFLVVYLNSLLLQSTSSLLQKNFLHDQV